jgi:hypothetical protein
MSDPCYFGLGWLQSTSSLESSMFVRLMLPWTCRIIKSKCLRHNILSNPSTLGLTCLSDPSHLQLGWLSSLNTLGLACFGSGMCVKFKCLGFGMCVKLPLPWAWQIVKSKCLESDMFVRPMSSWIWLTVSLMPDSCYLSVEFDTLSSPKKFRLADVKHNISEVWHTTTPNSV